MSSQVYNRIKAVLAEKRTSNNFLAEKLSVNVNTVSQWCTNRKQPSIETLFRIAAVLNVDVRELLVSSK